MKLVDKGLIIALGIEIEKIKNEEKFLVEQAMSKEEKQNLLQEDKLLRMV